MTKDKPASPADTGIDDPNPLTARSRAIQADIAADTKRLKSSTVALGAAVAAVMACAVGIVVLLVLRR